MSKVSSKLEKMKVIRDEILSLKESPLYSYRIENKYFPVIGSGSHDAQIVFVGEAPGKNEAETAVPFCGRSGKLLDEMLASIGLSRDSVYITNVVKDRPPENRDPTAEEIALYGPFLKRQIEIIQPKVIITLGRHSMNYIFNEYGIFHLLRPISAIHGHVFDFELSEHVKGKIVPLYHPAVALYNPNQKQVLFEDFKVVSSFID